MKFLRRKTLLIFLKAPVPGKVKTRLAKDIGAHAAVRVYRAMTDHIRSEVERLRNIRIIWAYDPAPRFPNLSWLDFNERPKIWKQTSGDLGRRLRYSISRAFREYGGPVCVIGTDCPGVKALHLRATFSALNRNDLVLGPAADGGYYLIGMNAFHPQLLSGIAWSTRRVLRQTLEKAEELRLRAHLLPEEVDIDTASDLRRWQKNTTKCGIII